MSDKGKKRKKWMYAKGGGGKRPRSWWRQLDVGMKGFLITCNNKEREAINEAYDLLNEYADQLYGPQQQAGTEKEDAALENDEESEEDIETALQKEVDALKKKKPSDRRFQIADSGAKNCVFIQTTVEDPTLLAHNVLSDLYETETSKSRYIMRMLPIIGTCKANEERIPKVASELLEPFFQSGERVSYCFNFKIRNNNTVSRSVLLPVLGHVMETLNPNTFVNMTDPDFTISVDVLRTVCCFSCVRDFNKFRKYNLQEVVHAKQSVKNTSASDTRTDVGDTDTDAVAKELSTSHGNEVKQQEESVHDSGAGSEESEVKCCKETDKEDTATKADAAPDEDTEQGDVTADDEDKMQGEVTGRDEDTGQGQVTGTEIGISRNHPDADTDEALTGTKEEPRVEGTRNCEENANGSEEGAGP